MTDTNNDDVELRKNNGDDEMKQEDVSPVQSMESSEQENQTATTLEEEVAATTPSVDVSMEQQQQQQQVVTEEEEDEDKEDVFEDEMSLTSLSERRGRKKSSSSKMMGSVASGRKSFRRNSDLSMQGNALTDDEDESCGGMDGSGHNESDRKLLFESYQRRAMMEKTFDMHNSTGGGFDAEGISNKIVEEGEEEKNNDEEKQQLPYSSLQNPQDPSIIIPSQTKAELKVATAAATQDDDDDSIRITNYSSDDGSSYASSIINDVFEDEPSVFGIGRKRKDKKKKNNNNNKKNTFLQSSTSMKRPTLFTRFQNRSSRKQQDFYEKNNNSCDDTVLANMENELRGRSSSAMTKKASWSSLLSVYSQNKKENEKSILMAHFVVMLTLFVSMSVMILVFLYYENGIITLGEAAESKAEKLGAAIMRKNPKLGP